MGTLYGEYQTREKSSTIMKKLLIITLLLFGQLSFAQQDTLQAKVGESADLIIILKKPAAYEDLKKLDLNKLVSEMMEGLEKSDTRVSSMKVYDRENFEKPAKKVLGKAYFNYFLGFSYANTYHNSELGFLTQLSNYNNSQLTNQTWNSYGGSLSNQVLASPYVSFSVNKDLSILRKSKVGLDLKMGAEPFFNYEKLNFTSTNLESSFPSGVYKSSDMNLAAGNSMFRPEFLDTLATAIYDEQNNLIRYSLYDAQNNVQNFVSYPYNVIKAGINLRFLPKFSVFNREGKRLFSLAVGPTAGLNLIRKSITKISSENAVADPVLISGTKPAFQRYGLAAELGIGGVSFFGQYVISGSVNHGQMETIANQNNLTFNSSVKNYRTHTVNFGLRFGK